MRTRQRESKQDVIEDLANRDYCSIKAKPSHLSQSTSSLGVIETKSVTNETDKKKLDINTHDKTTLMS